MTRCFTSFWLIRKQVSFVPLLAGFCRHILSQSSHLYLNIKQCVIFNFSTQKYTYIFPFVFVITDVYCLSSP